MECQSPVMHFSILIIIFFYLSVTHVLFFSSSSKFHPDNSPKFFIDEQKILMSSSSPVQDTFSEQEDSWNRTIAFWSTASYQQKLQFTAIASVVIFILVTFLLLCYWFIVHRQRLHFSSGDAESTRIVKDGLGLKKELRELLPVIVFKESFSVKDMQCSVCLSDYQSEDKLQQIPGCEHTFHMDCIDLWLTKHTTCPLCRRSLLALIKAPVQRDDCSETSSRISQAQVTDETGHQNCLQSQTRQEQTSRPDWCSMV